MRFADVSGQYAWTDQHEYYVPGGNAGWGFRGLILQPGLPRVIVSHRWRVLRSCEKHHTTLVSRFAPALPLSIFALIVRDCSPFSGCARASAEASSGELPLWRLKFESHETVLFPTYPFV